MTHKLTFPTLDSRRICSQEVGGLSGESEKHPDLMCSRLSSPQGCSLSQMLRPSSLAYQWTCFTSCITSIRTTSTGSGKKNHPEFDLLLLTVQHQGNPATVACAVEHHLSGWFLPWWLQLVLNPEVSISSVLDDAQPASSSDMASCSLTRQP